MCPASKELTEYLATPGQMGPGVLLVWTAVTGRGASLETRGTVLDPPDFLALQE